MRQNISSEDMPEVRFLLAVNYYHLGDVAQAKKYMDWDSITTTEQKLEMIMAFE
jgi:hypothetical protein